MPVIYSFFLSRCYEKRSKHSKYSEKVLNEIPEHLSHFHMTNRERSARKEVAERSNDAL